jgi:hypothetical protein
MEIIWAQNPLRSKIILTEEEKKILWHKIKIEIMEDRLYSAHFDLEEGAFFSLEKARKEVDIEFLEDVPDGISRIDKQTNTMYNHYLGNLEDVHIGDCTCCPSSCMKCHVEGLIGIDTIQGLGKFPGNNVESTFNKLGKDATCEQAIKYLKDNPVKATKDWHVPHIERWKKEQADAIAWLEKYKKEKLDIQEEEHKANAQRNTQDS